MLFSLWLRAAAAGLQNARGFRHRPWPGPPPWQSPGSRQIVWWPKMKLWRAVVRSWSGNRPMEQGAEPRSAGPCELPLGSKEEPRVRRTPLTGPRARPFSVLFSSLSSAFRTVLHMFLNQKNKFKNFFYWMGAPTPELFGECVKSRILDCIPKLFTQNL